jgi:hypothetical protein
VVGLGILSGGVRDKTGYFARCLGPSSTTQKTKASPKAGPVVCLFLSFPNLLTLTPALVILLVNAKFT